MVALSEYLGQLRYKVTSGQTYISATYSNSMTFSFLIPKNVLLQLHCHEARFIFFTQCNCGVSRPGVHGLGIVKPVSFTIIEN